MHTSTRMEHTVQILNVCLIVYISVGVENK